ncbi:general secretion pathway protein GspC [Caballeronia mineralivorans PML1(12)]|uniref:General secretion pathway protein GspC n=1 Tax=Caballeronia mineralivorans PML1(12) TaxID=908627 RepID=A0A0J1FY44_9BURK|nr:general secretion pathway protein GspC [Caballeronia mineralivorans]KLU24868.1 general secretion pathway protein GspC [Caballeronia mineralivorans PML1(12)]
MLRSFLRSFQSPTVPASVAAIALFAAVLAWWAWIFLAPAPAALARPAPQTSIDASAGATLFGAQPDHGKHDAVQLLGILSFDPHHAAAVVSVGDEAAHVVRINGQVADATTLSEVRAHSIVVERNGVQREITLPAVQNPSAFVR